MRRQARELALQILFQIEFAPQIPFQEFMQVFEAQFEPSQIQYADELIQGVIKNKSSIDAQIQKTSQHWKLDRMATVDRNMLRLAVYEMFFHSPNLKPSMAINEAVEIAKKYGSTDSASFVNGLLDQIAKNLS